MKPSAVRTRILEEHARLREILVALEPLNERLAKGEGAVRDQLLQQAQTLAEYLLDHVDHEDAILAPALRDADAWGDVRADKLVSHHREQRKEIAELQEALQKDSDEARTAARIRAFVAELRDDMKHEEEAILTTGLLRDDVVAINAEDG